MPIPSTCLSGPAALHRPTQPVSISASDKLLRGRTSRDARQLADNGDSSHGRMGNLNARLIYLLGRRLDAAVSGLEEAAVEGRDNESRSSPAGACKRCRRGRGGDGGLSGLERTQIDGAW